MLCCLTIIELDHKYACRFQSRQRQENQLFHFHFACENLKKRKKNKARLKIDDYATVFKSTFRAKVNAKRMRQNDEKCPLAHMYASLLFCGHLFSLQRIVSSGLLNINVSPQWQCSLKRLQFILHESFIATQHDICIEHQTYLR